MSSASLTRDHSNLAIVTPQSSADLQNQLSLAIDRSRDRLFSQQHHDGYWWYTLEANDSINAEYIFLLRYLNQSDSQTEAALARWLIKNQNADGSWSLFYNGPGDLSATVECYLALKMAGFSTDHEALVNARSFILDRGGITKIRVFTRIHLALFGLVSWDKCPKMPVALINLPDWSPLSIYEFSSWARACIVPLLVIMDQKKTQTIDINLDELYLDKNRDKWTYDSIQSVASFEYLFVQIDKALQVAEKMKLKPLRKVSLNKCERYIREHLETTADIYPAMFYGILALVALDYDLQDPQVQKAWNGLKSFQVFASHNDSVAEVPFVHSLQSQSDSLCYQQCCISPVWDTAWAGVALMLAKPDFRDERLIKMARWLVSKQILDVAGDWSVKAQNAKPGGWAFEFENKHYPDIDDTIEVLTALAMSDLPYRELRHSFERGLSWLLAMQCKNGGFAAFDKDNNLEMLNKIPFADHGACLDPPSPDITGRMVEFLISICHFDKRDSVVERAAEFIVKNQEKNGSFWGRWGVAYIYGTWGALGGLCALNRPKDRPAIDRAVNWLKSVQNVDGGFGESCLSDANQAYEPLGVSVASQTAWGLMGLISAGEVHSQEAHKAASFLISQQKSDGSWDEPWFTGTGFPGHFYIRYHGYRSYFPLMALAKYREALSGKSLPKSWSGPDRR